MNKLKSVILDTIIHYANEDWVSDQYDWTNDFIENYFINWFYDGNSCFYFINNDAKVYHDMLYILTQYGYPFMKTVDAFNTFVVLTAKMSFYDDIIITHVQNIFRIKKLKQLVPCIIHAKLLPELCKPILKYIGKKY